MQKLTIFAPAKLNLHLRVKSRRPDGFHDLESIFLALAFGDTLHFETLDTEGALEIEMKGQFQGIPVEKNIISRAVSLFRAKSGFMRGLRVCVEKRIPAGGGLGGGSSDGASTLLALNSLASSAGGLLNMDSLVEMGTCLGSDLPFFLHGARAAWVSGRGEQISPLETPELFHRLFFVLVNPGFSSETAEAYRLLDIFRSLNPSHNPQPPLSKDTLLKALAEYPRNWSFENDFLPVFGDAYQNIIFRLQEMGAEYAGLSGSGSTCFGVFSQQTAAEKAAECLSITWSFVKCTVFY